MKPDNRPPRSVANPRGRGPWCHAESGVVLGPTNQAEAQDVDKEDSSD